MIKVAAAALNFADVLQVQGLYQEKPKLPFIAGGEVSGHIVGCGDKVRGLRKGDQVLCCNSREDIDIQPLIMEMQQECRRSFRGSISKQFGMGFSMKTLFGA